MKIEIDNKSGFCFGVNNAINKAEKLMLNNKKLVCLGEIVHNKVEINRLHELGMTTADKSRIDEISNTVVLLRTHGEPPSTYQILENNNNTIIDATCPVVLKLQARIKKSYAEIKKSNGQLVIFGKESHAEVLGLVGQTNGEAIVVSCISDCSLIDFSRPIEMYCQTTMPLDMFLEVSDFIKCKSQAGAVVHDTICRQVANRIPNLRLFASQYDVVLFVSGKNSSNGKQLFEICLSVNPNTYFISQPEEIQAEWFCNKQSVGICGATSTPHWQMENAKQYVKAILNI